MSRVAVYIEDDDGQQSLWDVFNTGEVSWQLAGVGSNGSRAKLVVEGDFHRRWYKSTRGALDFGIDTVPRGVAAEMIIVDDPVNYIEVDDDDLTG